VNAIDYPQDIRVEWEKFLPVVSVFLTVPGAFGPISLFILIVYLHIMVGRKEWLHAPRRDVIGVVGPPSGPELSWFLFILHFPDT